MHCELIARYDRPGPRYTSYPTANEFHEGVGEGDLRGALRMVPADGRLSLYVHIPFCEERCLYCACNVIATKRRDVAGGYLEHLLREIELAAECLGSPRRAVDQLHLGGGTPTYFSSLQLRRLMEALRARFDIAEDAELAIEIDPRVTMLSQIATLQEQAEALADTVSVFRLEEGVGAPIDYHGVERRSPNRAINVARLKPAASVPAAPPVARSVDSTPAPRTPKAVNADESWEEF